MKAAAAPALGGFARRLIPVVLGLASCASLAQAGGVVVLQSGPLPPYQAAARGFDAAYPVGAVEMMLGDVPPIEMERRVRALGPDVVVTIGLRATLFARDRLSHTPIVFCAVPDPERYDLKGPWVTGVSCDVADAEQLAALCEALPAGARVGLLWSSADGEPIARRARAAAAAAHLTLVEAPIARLAELPGAARELAARVDALWLLPDPDLARPEAFRSLLQVSLESRRPLLVFSEALVRAGALVAVAPDYRWVGARAADAVRRIRGGVRAGDIPVAPLERTRVVVNRATAKAIGLDVGRALPDIAEARP